MKHNSIARRILDETTDTLRQVAGESAPVEAAALVADGLGIEEEALLVDLDRPISPDIVAFTRERVTRRTQGEPLAYVLGWCSFRGQRIVLDKRAIVPREHQGGLLVDFAMNLPIGAHVVDVGTGSGAIALAVAHERPDLFVTASDVSSDAVAVARANADLVGLDISIVVADGVPPGKYDLVLANPPYARSSELARLPAEAVDFEPHLGIIAGDDGLDVVRAIAATTSPGVRLALTHAANQTEAVRSLLAEPETQGDSRSNDWMTVGRAK